MGQSNKDGALHQSAGKVISVGFSAVIVLMLILAVATLLRIEHIQQSVRDISREKAQHAQLAHRMYDIARVRAYLLFSIAYTDDPFLADELSIRFKALANEFGQARQDFRKLRLSPEEEALVEKQRLAVVETVSRQEVLLDLVAAGKTTQAREVLIKQVLPAQENVLITLSQLIEMQDREMARASLAAEEDGRKAFLLLLIGTLVVTILSVRVAFQVRGNMAALIQNLTDKSEQLRLSLGDLEFQKQALDEHAIVSIADRQGRIVYVNDRFCEVSQYTRDELIGNDHRIVHSGQHPREFFQELWRTIASGKIWHGQVCNRRKDGALYWADTTILPVLDDSGRPCQYVSIRTEITAIKEAEALQKRGKEELEALVNQRTAELTEREAVLQQITGAAQEAIVMVDHDDKVTFWNAAAEKLFGYAREEILGQELHPLLMPSDMKERHAAAFCHFSATGNGSLVHKTTELRARHRDGHVFPIDLSLSAIQLKGEWHGIGIARDITDRKQAEEALRLLADTDTLTRLPNRRKFDASLLAEVSRAERHATSLTLIMLDIDHFKAVNDTCGHQAGDSVLVELARLVSDQIRTYDIFARWGGEEFAILAPNSDCEASTHFADKLRALIARHEFAGVGKLTISLGLASFQPGEPIDRFVARADKALYMAKEGGRNRVVGL